MQEHDRIQKLTETSNDNNKQNDKQKQDRNQYVTASLLNCPPPEYDTFLGNETPYKMLLVIPVHTVTCLYFRHAPVYVTPFSSLW